MKKNINRSFIISGAIFAIFVLFTILVKFVDVQQIGEGGTSVGFASLNGKVFNVIGVHMVWYNITDWLGFVPIAVALSFAVLGLVQLIKRKSIKKVDSNILLLGAFYILVAAFYIFFEIVIVNYRPIILYVNPEASYPSSHTMICIAIMLTAMYQFRHLFKDNKKLIFAADVLSWFIIIITVVGRLISGVHWFTDILGGIMLAFALTMLYISTVELVDYKKNNANN